MADCKTCKEKEFISRHVHEADLDRADRNSKRWFIAWLITFVLLVGCVAGFIWYESQWEVVEETTHTEVQQDADGFGNNTFIGGDYNGSSDNTDNDLAKEPEA